jgi:P-type E1-E2 ATPase
MYTLCMHTHYICAIYRPQTAVVMHAWPSTAEETSDVAIAQLQCGDVCKIIRGSKAPADAIVVQGTAAFDESMLTGESMPVNKVSNNTLTLTIH